jgi:hypothetical protein
MILGHQNNANKSYITVTEHHIDKTWNMNSNVLVTREMPERHTADNHYNREQPQTSILEILSLPLNLREDSQVLSYLRWRL